MQLSVSVKVVKKGARVWKKIKSWLKNEEIEGKRVRNRSVECGNFFPLAFHFFHQIFHSPLMTLIIFREEEREKRKIMTPLETLKVRER